MNLPDSSSTPTTPLPGVTGDAPPPRASRMVAPIRPMRAAPSSITRPATHSAPTRVLPAPRPPRNSQMRQSLSGASCAWCAW